MGRLILFLLLCLFSFSTTNVNAHSIGQPPYFKINGIFTDYYPVPSSSLADFKLPQDIAKGQFLINQAINFEIDPALLPVPPEIVEKTKFTWEFGDGGKAEGLKNSHMFQRSGTYFLDIYADSEGGFEPQLLQSTVINILPSKDYKLPKSVIRINGKESKDPLLDLIDVNFGKEISFSGKESQSGSSEIAEYLWDLGDLTSESQVEFKYKYSENPYTVFPVLRIKTKDGFIADSFVKIKDKDAFTESDSGFLSPIKDGSFDWKLIAITIFASLISAGVLTWIISKFIKK